MRILFSASHLLHWRSLIPVACELVHRGHSITVQGNRPNWMGMPTFQMNWTPTKVTGVNKASLAWLADRTGHGQEWQAAQDHIDYTRYFVPEEYDTAVSTTKDMDFLQDMEHELNSYMMTYAVGYQHFPVVLRDTFDAERAWQRGITDMHLDKYSTDLPAAFKNGHPFSRMHGFDSVASCRRIYGCGFPHLDKVKIPQSHKQQGVLIQHHGGYRGITGHAWLVETVRIIGKAGYCAYICPHFIPGVGYGADAIHLTLTRAQILGWQIVKHWWDVAGECDLILTTGSSAAYEMWSIGLTNVFILGYVGGTRHEKFSLFKDLIVESPEALGTLLRGLPGSAQATEPLTQEVMAAYRSVHNGQGAKTAADVIEGKV